MEDRSLNLACLLCPDDYVSLLHMKCTGEMNIEMVTEDPRALASVTLTSTQVKELYFYLDRILLGDLKGGEGVSCGR